jgi:hypothetical protein
MKQKLMSNKKFIIYELPTKWYYFIVMKDNEIIEARLHYNYALALHDYNKTKRRIEFWKK